MRSFTNKQILLVAILLLAGCQYKSVPPPQDYGLMEIIRLYGENGPWTKEKLEASLVGEWQWKKQVCAGFGGIGTDTEQYKAYSIRLNTDKSLQLLEAGQVVHTSTWSITFSGNSGDFDPPQAIYNFATDPKSNDYLITYSLTGWMYLGGNVLVLSLIPVDGCDNFFEKVQ